MGNISNDVEKLENMEMFSCSPTELFSGSPTDIFSGPPTLSTLFMHSIYGILINALGERDPGSAQNSELENVK